jgi:hypothetical protein
MLDKAVVIESACHATTNENLAFVAERQDCEG